LNAILRLSSHFNVGLHDTLSYQNGFFQSPTGEQIMSGLGSPTALNQTILPYTTRMLLNSSGLDLTYVMSQRTSLTLTGGDSQRKFGSQVAAGEPLYNNRDLSGGLQYQYRVTEHNSFGFLLLHQDTSYRGGEVFGNSLRFQIESAFVSAGSRLSPTLTATIFAGPQYVRIIGAPALRVGGTLEPFQVAGGGSITKQVRKTALDLSAQRIVSDSGGLYALVKSTTASFGVRQRLAGRWEASWQGGVARADTSLLLCDCEGIRGFSGQFEALFGQVALERPLSRDATLRVSYESMHQLSRGSLPISGTFDRNLVMIGMAYRLKAIPLGR
jgi:hypothetical protein